MAAAERVGDYVTTTTAGAEALRWIRERGLTICRDARDHYYRSVTMPTQRGYSRLADMGNPYHASDRDKSFDEMLVAAQAAAKWEIAWAHEEALVEAAVRAEFPLEYAELRAELEGEGILPSLASDQAVRVLRRR